MQSTTPALPSPAKRRYDSVLSNSPPSLQHKRIRTVFSPPFDTLLTPPLYAFAPSENDNLDTSAKSRVVAVSNGLPASLEADKASSGLDSSHSILDAESQAVRIALNDAMKAGKGTEVAYMRHIKNYVKFMVQDQA
ncbi:hypothetical protein H0H87_012692, partial [Tephrocybe sp. NHM501043]